MKTLIQAIFIAISFGVALSAEKEIDYANINPKVMVRGIDKFLEAPSAKEAKGYASIIMGFARASDDVYAKITVERQPWLLLDKPPENCTLLTAAYVGGNIKKQLELGKKVDSPKDGFAAALVVYKKLRLKNQLPLITEMEKWSELSVDQIWNLVKAAESK